MKENNIIPRLEALLFIYAEPISVKKISMLLNVAEEHVNKSVKELSDELKREERGLTIIQLNHTVQMVTKPKFSFLVEQISKGEVREELSPAALETLSIIAYGGPITKNKIEYIRGVNSAFTLRNLLLRNLVVLQADKYQISINFLKKVGLNNIKQLPKYALYHEFRAQ